MSQVFLRSTTYILIMLLAMTYRRKDVFVERDRVVLSRLSMNITLPCALIAGFKNFKFESAYVSIVLFGFFINIIIVILTVLIMKKSNRLEKATYFLNTSSFNIGSFAIPFSSGLFPASQVVTLIMFDIGNGIYSLGVNHSIAKSYVNKKSNFDIVPFLKTLMSSTPLVVYSVMLLLYALNVSLPEPVFEIAQTIGSANMVVVMTMFGIMIGAKEQKIFTKGSVSIVILRYVISGILAIFFWNFSPYKVEIKKLIVLALMTPMSSLAPVFCSKLGADIKSYQSVISISIILSIALCTILILTWQV